MKRTQSTQSTRIATVALTATAVAGAFLANPGEAADAPAKKGWETVASAGLTLTRGNSETFLGTLGVNSQRKWSADEILLGANGGYGESTSKDPVDGSDEHNTTDQYAKGFGQWNHLFLEKLYGGLRVEGLYDEIAGVDYRFTISPLLGYYVIKNATTFLAFEGGPSLVLENLAGPRQNADQYLTLRLADRFEHKFSDKAKIWQTAEYLPRVTDFNDYILNVEVGVSAAITSSVDLRVVLQDTYDNVPAPGRKNNDLKLIAGVGYKF